MSSIALVAIQSVAFPSVFLRMNGSNVSQTEGNGSGIVNCQHYDQGRGPNYPTPNIGNDEVFELIPIGELSFGPGYAIRSLNYGQAFWRMDGSNVTQPARSGGGTVNCQYYSGGSYPQNNSGDYEHFIIGSAVLATQSHPTYWFILSGRFPGVFLRIDGFNFNQSSPGGGGTVNCQYYPSGNPSAVSAYEVFNIIYLQPPSRPV
jgi:hypothetical protein